MKVEEFKTLKAGDRVTVCQWQDMARTYGLIDGERINTPGWKFTPNMRAYCGKTYMIQRINHDLLTCTLKDEGSGEVCLGMFTNHSLEPLNKAEQPAEAQPEPREVGEPEYDYLTYCIPAKIEKHMRRKAEGEFYKQAVCGKIGEPTKLKDSNGEPLFIGDIVTVFNDDIDICVGFAPVTRAKDYGAIVCGIADDYSEKRITDEWSVIKSIDWSAVRNGAVVNNVRYNVKK